MEKKETYLGIKTPLSLSAKCVCLWFRAPPRGHTDCVFGPSVLPAVQ